MILPPGTIGLIVGGKQAFVYLSAHAIAAGKIPNNIRTPYVPAKSNALKKISGFNSENTIGGTIVNKYGTGCCPRPDGSLSKSERKSVRPKTNPIYEVPIARKENVSTIGPKIPLVERNCSNGSSTWTPLEFRCEIVPRITASHTRNIAKGMLVPNRIALLTFGRFPSRFVQRTGTTFWYTKAKQIMGMLWGTALIFACKRELQSTSPAATATRAAKDIRIPSTKNPLMTPMTLWLPK